MQAEQQSFHTWVDEHGRVHNIPLKQPSQPKVSKAEQKAGQETQTYLTEEALKEQQEQDRKERPPFYTWTDGQGQLRSEVIPDGQAETSESSAEAAVTDHTLLPSLRLPGRENIACCSEFQSRFKKRLEPLKSILFSRPQQAELMPTKSGLQPAWYVKAPNYQLDWQGEHFPVLSVRVRGNEQPLSMIVLDAHYRPLHYLENMHSQLQPETWHSVAYHESLISIADESAYAFIFYFATPATHTTSIEVKWHP